MNSKIIGGITVDWEGDMDDNELAAYVQRGKDKYGNNLRSVCCVPEDDYVGITYTVKAVRFQRLRRITGKPTK